ncbi:MAG: B12-binding domain-containing radical SAM protein [Bacillota bacterium]|jgi:radical SAM superfamily enzyme YgiQ (UPF0313 family)
MNPDNVATLLVIKNWDGLMKILLTTLNAKCVHTSLALWYLYQYLRSKHPGLAMREFNINQELPWVLGEIYRERPAVVAFSCNIWNIEAIFKLCRRLRQVTPEIRLVLGGPEVGAEPEAVLIENPAVDFIIVGEGEVTFEEFLDQLGRAQPEWRRVAGLVYRDGKTVVVNCPRPQLADLSGLPFPYPEDLTPLRKKMVYYETSRGCPYNCQYCLSANERGVRFFELETVKRDLLRFIAAGVGQVKLVDRSFNCNPKWAKTLWRFLLEHPGTTNFHFEIVGDLLDDESLAILRQAPAGLFQFEIGVQSTNPETLRMVKRQTDWPRLQRQVGKLIRDTKVFVHLDLIAGLPGEDYASFARTFNETMALRPHRLQLGFLKLLKGSGLRKEANTLGYQYTREAPYEVLANPWLSYAEMLKLKDTETVFDRYYNSDRFNCALRYLLAWFATPFGLFETLGAWWKSQGYDQIAHKPKELYRYLLRFYQEQQVGEETVEVLRNLLKFDLLSQERMVELPEWAGAISSELRKFSFKFWQDPAQRRKYFAAQPELAVRDLQRRTLIVAFALDPQAVAADPLAGPVWVETTYLFIYQPTGVKSYQIQGRE